jgi:hypothetical protein
MTEMKSETASTRRLLLDYLSREFADIKAPASVSLAFPFEAVIADFRSTEFRLWTTALSQYEEYDRIRSEAEVRSAITPPLLALGITIAARYSLWIGLGLSVAFCVLPWQAMRLRQRGGELLANAIHQGVVGIPQIEEIVANLKSRNLEEDAEGSWLGATITALMQRGLFDQADAMITEIITRETVAIRHSAADFIEPYSAEAAQQLRPHP